jgi:hypothetical protein
MALASASLAPAFISPEAKPPSPPIAAPIAVLAARLPPTAAANGPEISNAPKPGIAKAAAPIRNPTAAPVTAPVVVNHSNKALIFLVYFLI